MSKHLSKSDLELINILQDDLPLTHRPFQKIGAQLGLNEQEVICQIKRLLENGELTRFGPFFDIQAMGGKFCLCAMAVPTDQYDTVAEKVNSLHQVAHNYQRDHNLNMWFVLATESEDEIEDVAQTIERDTGISVLLFPKEKEFFVGFKVNT